MGTNYSFKFRNQTSTISTTPCSIFCTKTAHFKLLKSSRNRFGKWVLLISMKFPLLLLPRHVVETQNLGVKNNGFALTSGLDSFLSVSNSLMHMYSKAGKIDCAIVIFEKLTNPNIVSWNTLLSGINNSNGALGFACRMNHIGVMFDAVTYTSALAHCANCEEFLFGIQLHSLVLKTGMQSEGYSQEGSYGEQAFTGRLEGEEGLMWRIPGRVGNGIGTSVLQSLLGNYKVYGDFEVRKRVGGGGGGLLNMDPTKSGSYVLLSNLYAKMGEWDEVARIRKSMKERNVKKVVGLSWVDVCDVGGYSSTHVFSSNDMSHPRMVEIYWMVGILGVEIRFLKG
uniref:Pentatricopeptide repeat-containing protein n=1 Tax=Lactuca sativa TaxID=4236 RepID=A0A9R1VNC2_LACSA|nr:hypothetical protein LSAT_V11C500263700 [Lactuca sativa]